MVMLEVMPVAFMRRDMLRWLQCCGSIASTSTGLEATPVFETCATVSDGGSSR